VFAKQFPRNEKDRIATFEEEFPYNYHDDRCYLWFFENDLPGYSWYVPKGNGYVNVGIGAKIRVLKERGERLRDHWHHLTERLEAEYLVGDAAGLATIDMGEGIGPAIHSGILAARSILTGKPYSLKPVARYSAWDLFFWWRWRV